MKNILLLSVALVSLVSCRNDDDKTSNSSELSVVGTWKHTKHIIYDGKTKKVLISSNVDDCSAKSRIEFLKDGKCSVHNYELVNNTCIDNGIQNGVYTYDANAKKMTATLEGENT